MIYRKENAKFDPYQDEVLSAIEALFPEVSLIATRGHSTPLEQLHIIGSYAQAFRYPEFDPQDVYKMVDVEIDGEVKHVYAWLRTWGECLHRGLLINPPLAAIVPFDYVRKGVNKKGRLIKASDHIVELDLDPRVKTCPIDFSQRIGPHADIDRVAAIMRKAQESGVPILSITVEHGNGCVHNTLKKKETIQV